LGRSAVVKKEILVAVGLHVVLSCIVTRSNQNSGPQSDYCSVLSWTHVALCLAESRRGTRKHVLCREIIKFSKFIHV
jgi:hypothetical protein